MAMTMRKRHKRGYNDIVDEMGGLPDEILVSILSLLPLKEAAATSILSRRWRHLWTSTSTLTFDSDIMLYFDPTKSFKSETSKYINWVDSVMEQHRVPNIEHLKISFDLDESRAVCINKWIQIALKKRVQILELDLLEWGCFFQQDRQCYKLPRRLLHSNRDYIGSLKVLDFKSVAVDGKILEYLLSSCPLLERLSVYDSQKLVKLRVVGLSIALKYLSIERCYKIKSIEICDAPKLVSLIYHGESGGENLNSFLIRNVPLLVEVSILAEWMESFFKAGCLSQLEILRLYPSMRYEKYLQFPPLANLKYLELRVIAHDQCSLLQLTSVMKACPYLHRFVLQLRHFTPAFGGSLIKMNASKSPHYYLKVVEIAGYRGQTSDYEYVKYFIENAVELEKLIINPVKWTPYVADRNRIPKSISEVKMEDEARAHARQHVREKVPSNIEFVCI
ncbi:putative F-box domain, FBD domain, leucine-rich repeat domain, L domain-containing protein [Rosa chinensis]|uniref:Putative F-box domain, FBD domain, leucine-rich repeat domain, L domain-containing protein n=1 Tax=Rosa chinensis TaxID=74649 RepID=A0A2P6SBC3_ROSCH|nr:F-box/LRR-repeat protein At3g26922 isoform X2 [Rosa chinensis]PRQ55965.1 putative F-box domain, FBD domain, leucine-rich repeat domain, L domain-containing protein [Rosa chinensis]